MHSNKEESKSDQPELLTFHDFEYKRPDFDQFSNEFNSLLKRFVSGSSDVKQSAVLRQINSLRRDFTSMHQIASIRHEMDTANVEYLQEKEFFDKVLPKYEELTSAFYKALLETPYKQALQKQWGKQIFTIAKLQITTFVPEILEDLLEENQLGTAYGKLDAAAMAFFDGEERTQPQLLAFMESTDREIRKNANKAFWEHYRKNEAEYDRIFDQLVKVRHRMALKLGYENFIQPGYARMLRSDYGPDQVAIFRKQVLDTIVPLAAKLKKRQAGRLGIEKLIYYDQRLSYPSGNPIPMGNPDWILQQGKKMYEDLSSETHSFFRELMEKEVLDVLSRKGKSTGGFCTYIPKYKTPFIFANFNGTSSDIDVLTHEAGHAYQVYASRDQELVEYSWPSLEACEIHSMSMQFLTHPFMERFFGDQTEKFIFAHLNQAICDIPYLCLVDHFQHWIYSNPHASPGERKSAWRNLESQYLPWADYDDNDFLKRVGIWYKILHIFQMPFYFIDYALAMVCALQFWKRSRENNERALSDYFRLCKAGGSLAFLELVKLANLQSPFKEGSLESVVHAVEEYLDGIDDSVF